MAALGDAVAAHRERAERARAVLAEGAYLRTPGAVLVYARTPGIAGYTIEDGGACPCNDRQLGEARRLGIACYHEMAAELVRAGRPAAPRTLPPRDEIAWLDEQDARAAARRRSEEIEEEFGL